MKIDATQEKDLERIWHVLKQDAARVSGQLPYRWTLDFKETAHDSGRLHLSFGGRVILAIERDAEYREWRVSTEAPEVEGREADVIGMTVRAAKALIAERKGPRMDADLIGALDALRPVSHAEDLVWMSGPVESVLHDAFTSGPFHDKGVAVAWAEAGHVLVGKKGGRNVLAFHLAEGGEIEIAVADLPERLADIEGKTDDGPQFRP
jgi:hypothetical protein